MKVQNKCQTKVSFHKICFFQNVHRNGVTYIDNDGDRGVDDDQGKEDSSDILFSNIFLLICCCLHVTMHVSIVANYDGFFVLVFYHIA